MSTSWPGLLLISEQVVETLREFSGWATFPVSVIGKKEEVITGYSGLAVTGRAGPVDNRRSEPREITSRGPKKRPGREWYGIYFSEDTWDGSDLFTLEGTAMTVVVQEVRVAFERAGITNVTFAALSERRNTNLPTEFF